MTANEGDARKYDAYEELSRIEDLTLDPTAFPNAADLQAEDAHRVGTPGRDYGL